MQSILYLMSGILISCASYDILTNVCDPGLTSCLIDAAVFVVGLGLDISIGGHN